jgi:hypothetical protein
MIARLLNWLAYPSIKIAYYIGANPCIPLFLFALQCLSALLIRTIVGTANLHLECTR